MVTSRHPEQNVNDAPVEEIEFCLGNTDNQEKTELGVDYWNNDKETESCRNPPYEIESTNPPMINLDTISETAFRETGCKHLLGA